jgi:hypothetical protein
MKDVSLGRYAVIAVALAIAPTAAMAYIDPGNGAYMVQIIFTLAGAALFYVRHPIRTCKGIWNSLTKRGKSIDATQQEDIREPLNPQVPETISGAGRNSTHI